MLLETGGGLLETHRGNGFLSSSRKAISGAEMGIFNEGKTARKRSNAAIQAPKGIGSGQMKVTFVFS